MKKYLITALLMLAAQLFASPFQTVTFPSKDGLTITADLYMPHPDSAPFIVLFHQAGFSRGEYREIAPELNRLGFNALAIDQRSGREVNGVVNETATLAEEKKMGNSYLDALQDMEAAIGYAKENYAKGKLIIWGSSYSAALVLKIAGEYPNIANGVLAFSPGEYFTKLGKSDSFITQSAKHITMPVFITSAKSEKDRWWSIYQAIPGKKKTDFIPQGEGIHGSRALWQSTPDHAEYWNAVKEFLKQFEK